MGAFNYTALDHKGRERKGTMEGETPKQIRQQLRNQGLNPLVIDTIKQSATDKSVMSGLFQPKVTVSDLALLTRQAATLLAAGMPLEEVLLAVSEQSEKPRVKSILLAVRSNVLEGQTLAKGLADFSSVFPNVYRATVQAGEKSGYLDKVLNSLADYTEKQQLMRQKVQQALIYPGVMMFVSLSIVTFLLVYVVPQMISVFNDTGQQLPLLTQILLAISYSIQHYGIWALLLVIIGVAAFRNSLKREAFRYNYHRFLLRIPMIGKSIKIVNTARFSRTFGILSSAGVPVLEAMHVASELVVSLPIRDALETAAKRVGEGATINSSLKSTGYFPPMSVHLIASGESSGQLEEMLRRAADNQERSVTMLIENLLSLFEPVMILLMGSVVLFIVLAILLPIFAINELI